MFRRQAGPNPCIHGYEFGRSLGFFEVVLQLFDAVLHSVVRKIEQFEASLHEFGRRFEAMLLEFSSVTILGLRPFSLLEL